MDSLGQTSGFAYLFSSSWVIDFCLIWKELTHVVHSALLVGLEMGHRNPSIWLANFVWKKIYCLYLRRPITLPNNRETDFIGSKQKRYTFYGVNSVFNIQSVKGPAELNSFLLKLRCMSLGFSETIAEWIDKIRDIINSAQGTKISTTKVIGNFFYLDSERLLHFSRQPVLHCR